MNIEIKSINTLRALGLAMIDKANSGHPGIVLGAAPMLYTLYTRHINASSNDYRWVNRDRFIMAAGHGSALYYSLLHLANYDVTIDDLKDFRQFNSKTPGHPEYMHTPGVDATSGPLGQGIAMACGIAMAEEFLRAKYSVVNHYTYVLCGDGDLQEGVTQEAMSLAGVQKIGRLIVLYDSNDIQLDTDVSSVNIEDVKTKYEAMNWQYILVEDGNDVDAIDQAILAAKADLDKPTIIEVKTKIGYGSSKQGTSAVHGSPLGFEESKSTMENLGYDFEAFEVCSSVYDHFKETFGARGSAKFKSWNSLVEEYAKECPNKYEEVIKLIQRNFEIDFAKIYKNVYNEETRATRVHGGHVLDEISKNHPFLLAGSADLSGSTKVKGSDGVYCKDNRLGRNILFGVREHAMGAIANGFVLHSGIDAVVSGFFVFSDYLKPAIRMAALMNIPTIFTFTHDSVAVGEDGPTHEPVEQLDMLRSTPNIDVFRPADLSEVVASYEMALTKQNPSAIILSRQDLVSLKQYTSISEAKKGAYVVKDYDNIDGIIIACGSELSLAIEVSEKLAESNIFYRVVSMLSMEVFNSKPAEYIEEILPSDIRNRIAIEMSRGISYYQYVGLDGKVFGINTYGISAPGDKAIEHFGFDKDSIVYEIIKKSKE